MSATVTYKGETLTTATNQTRVLETEGTYLEDDITITDVTTIPTGTKNISITANGTTTEDVTNYASASITANVPNSYSASDEGKVVSSGALVAQTSDTVTVNDTYDTTLINSLTVNVSGGGEPELLYNWDFTQGLTDTVKSQTITLTNATRDSSGLHFDAANARAVFGVIMPIAGNTYEIDISSSSRQGTAHGRFLMATEGNGFIYRNTGKWGIYDGAWQDSTITQADYFSGHTMKMVFDSYGIPSIYRDDDLAYSGFTKSFTQIIQIGSSQQTFYEMTITGLRVYAGDTTEATPQQALSIMLGDTE